jgi:hypothetical protein
MLRMYVAQQCFELSDESMKGGSLIVAHPSTRIRKGLAQAKLTVSK